MERRKFLELAGLGLGGSLVSPGLAANIASRTQPTPLSPKRGNANTYGSGHFGKWICDSFELPAYQYTCNQIADAKAVSAVDKAWRNPTDHTHQVGNGRLVAVASNYGYVQVRQDEGAPKFLNDYCPEQNRYGAGIGFLADENIVLSTFCSGAAESFERIFGMGYLRKRITGQRYEIDHVIFAPFGDDPVLISQVMITNHSKQSSRPRWVEYWGCQNYQFSYRSLMEAALLGEAIDTPKLRREVSSRFVHRFEALKNGNGLLETQTFRGRTPEEEELWQKVQAALKANPTGFYGGPVLPLAHGASMDDLHPPPTFLVSLDAPADALATNGAEFFKGGIERPSGMSTRLNNDLATSGPESALFLERDLALNPGESRTMYFLYGYLPEGFEVDRLVAKYTVNMSSLWSRSSSQWKESSLLFRTESEPWVERETAWSSYYLRSAITYDSFFREHIISQGSSVQYIAGIQGAARDPLQHALPLIFTDPKIVREVIRYTLKEIQPDGSLPYGIVGCGVPMPCRYRPSDLELWLLWLASEYILATRHKEFLDETIPSYPRRESSPDDLTVRELLSRTYARVIGDIGVGKHGLMRLFNGDWNDSIVVNRLTPAQVAEVSQHGESVLNAAMAVYVLDHYARMLDFTDRPDLAIDARAKAEAQRQVVRQQWTGRWFRRAWLGEELGWSGEKQLWLEPQPWAVIGGSATPEQVKTLVAAMEELMRKPTPIGAALLSQPDPTMHNQAGVGTNGGTFLAINGTLIWALALVNGYMAWDEWKKNSFARHAEVYPDRWYGIWSGPDAYHSALSKTPGDTEAEFPVMNMHSHAWPLYSAAKLLGLGFHESGIDFHPDLPLPQYEFASPLLGFKKSPAGYSGWYAPKTAGHWNIAIVLPDAVRARLRQITVNGVTQALRSSERGIRFRGESKPNAPLRWEVI
jgi:Glycosyl hydrolase 36 superfamily, catalytic domain